MSEFNLHSKELYLDSIEKRYAESISMITDTVSRRAEEGYLETEIIFDTEQGIIFVGEQTEDSPEILYGTDKRYEDIIEVIEQMENYFTYRCGLEVIHDPYQRFTLRVDLKTT